MVDLPRTLASFAELQGALDVIERAPVVRTTRGWSPFQALVHCAQSIEYAVSGFPQMRSRLFRHVVGPLAAKKFLRHGSMSHDLTAAIPGAPTIDADGEFREATTRLRNSIDLFRGSAATLRPHFAYGSLRAEDYEKLQVMHIADHLSAFVIEG